MQTYKVVVTYKGHHKKDIFEVFATSEEEANKLVYRKYLSSILRYYIDSITSTLLKPPLRWLVTYTEHESEFAGKRSTAIYDSKPVLQYWDGSEYVDVPVERLPK